MRYLRSRAWRLAAALAAPLALAAGLTGLTPAAASAATCVSLTGALPFVPSNTDNTFTGVTAISPCDVWAAGFDFSGGADRTLTEHWDGSNWTRVSSPDFTGSDFLGPVAATSTGGFWTVGAANADGPDPEQAIAIHCC